MHTLSFRVGRFQSSFGVQAGESIRSSGLDRNNT